MKNNKIGSKFLDYLMSHEYRPGLNFTANGIKSDRCSYKNFYLPKIGATLLSDLNLVLLSK